MCNNGSENIIGSSDVSNSSAIEITEISVSSTKKNEGVKIGPSAYNEGNKTLQSNGVARDKKGD